MVTKKITLREKADRVRKCTNCALHTVGSGPIPYSGKPSPLMVIGEAPGRQEDLRGKPFVGPAGRLLWEELAKLGIKRTNCMVANAVSCYPAGTPTEMQIFACAGNIYDIVKYCNPSLILALGRTANFSLGPGRFKSMKELHGNWYELAWFPIRGEDRKPRPHADPHALVMPTYHPAALLRNRALMRQWREDLRDFAWEAKEVL